jgi:hypothetical protein
MSHKDALGLHGGAKYLICTDNNTPTKVPSDDMEHTIISPWPNSPDVAGLVHDRLSRIQQQFSDNSPSTLSNLRTVVDELSTIAKTCATVLDDIETRDEGTDVVTALKELQAALDWAKCMFPCPTQVRRRVTKISGSPPVCTDSEQFNGTRVSFSCTPSHVWQDWQLRAVGTQCVIHQPITETSYSATVCESNSKAFGKNATTERHG